VSDLTEGIHVARVVYTPPAAVDAAVVAHPAFVADSAHAASFMVPQGGDGATAGSAGGEEAPSGSAPSSVHTTAAADAATAGAQAAWAAGFGTLAVYLDDEAQPVLIVPLQLDGLLDLGPTHGRAWVGFTAATGSDVWQTHDVLAWAFTQLRL
jgi:hypothetical protein